MNLLMERLYKQTGNVLQSGVPICLGVYITAYTVNALAGTPNILKTMAPGAFISTAYTFSYLLSLKQIASQESGCIEDSA